MKASKVVEALIAAWAKNRNLPMEDSGPKHFLDWAVSTFGDVEVDLGIKVAHVKPDEEGEVIEVDE